MGIFDTRNDFDTDDEIVDLTEADIDELADLFMYDELAHLPQETLRRFAEDSDFAEKRDILQEKGMINKSDLMRLSKGSDMERRTSLTAMMFARKNNDALWKKYAKILQMKKDLKANIIRKYSSRSKMAANKAQRAYIKKTGGITNYVIRSN